MRHAKSVHEASNAEVAAAMDVKEEVARDLAERYGVPWTTDLDELLSMDGIDAVYIATPHHLHAPIAIKAAEAGKHIMVEKPIATTLEDARKMIEAAESNGVLLSVCFISRYRVDAAKAKELVEKGAIGEVIGLTIYVMSDKPETYWHGGYTGRVRTDWRTKKAESGGGILIMNAVHNIDLLRFITGLKPVRVYAEYDTFATPVEVEDWISVVVRYENGAIGSIDASSCARGRGISGDRIYGKEGQIVLGNPLRVFTRLEVEGLKPGEWSEIKLEQPKDPRTLYVEGFAEAVLSGAEKPPVTGEDGLEALKLILAAYKSGETKQPVEIN